VDALVPEVVRPYLPKVKSLKKDKT